jgi:hypothetical protein
MTNSSKGLLLSGLVFPGLGQLVLGRRKRGIVFMLAVVACLIVIVQQATHQALAMLDKIQASGAALDMATISGAAAQASANTDSGVIPLVFVTLMAVWIAASVDAYRIGRQKDQEHKE